MKYVKTKPNVAGKNVNMQRENPGTSEDFAPPPRPGSILGLKAAPDRLPYMMLHPPTVNFYIRPLLIISLAENVFKSMF